MESTSSPGESGSAPPLGGGTLQIEPDPFAELDPGIFDSGETTTERNHAETQTQTGEETETSSSESESDVEMRESERLLGKEAGSDTGTGTGTGTDPPSVTLQSSSTEHAGMMRISDLSAAEIKKRYREIVSKENPSKGKNIDNQPVYSKAIPAEADVAQSESYKKIHASKMLKGVPAASGGTGTGQVLNSKCGSFYNPGDNRISRTVYQKDLLSLCRLHTAFLHWPLSSAATKKVQGPDTT
jgi:hypothetical protein